MNDVCKSRDKIAMLLASYNYGDMAHYGFKYFDKYLDDVMKAYLNGKSMDDYLDKKIKNIVRDNVELAITKKIAQVIKEEMNKNEP